MAIVAEYIIRGVKVKVSDEAYRDASPEEIERRRAEARRVAGRLIARIREREEAKEAARARADGEAG